MEEKERDETNAQLDCEMQELGFALWTP